MMEQTKVLSIFTGYVDMRQEEELAQEMEYKSRVYFWRSKVDYKYLAVELMMFHGTEKEYDDLVEEYKIEDENFKIIEREKFDTEAEYFGKTEEQLKSIRFHHKIKSLQGNDVKRNENYRYLKSSYR